MYCACSRLNADFLKPKILGGTMQKNLAITLFAVAIMLLTAVSAEAGLFKQRCKRVCRQHTVASCAQCPHQCISKSSTTCSYQPSVCRNINSGYQFCYFNSQNQLICRCVAVCPSGPTTCSYQPNICPNINAGYQFCYFNAQHEWVCTCVATCP